MTEHAQRVKAATNAATLGELRELVGDLQTGNALDQLPTLKAPALGGSRAGWGLYGNTSSPLSFTSDPGAKPDAMPAVVGVLHGTPETLNIKADEVKSAYLVIDPSRDPTAPDSLSVSVRVSSDFGSGYVELAPDGRVKRINYP